MHQAEFEPLDLDPMSITELMDMFYIPTESSEGTLDCIVNCQEVIYLYVAFTSTLSFIRCITVKAMGFIFYVTVFQANSHDGVAGDSPSLGENFWETLPSLESIPSQPWPWESEMNYPLEGPLISDDVDADEGLYFSPHQLLEDFPNSS